MTPHEAAKLLDLPAEASPEQLESRFLELRTKLEDKIAKAPTPGLKAKYRESLEQITTAFESLTFAADSSALPVLQKQPSGGGAISPSASPAASASDNQKPKTKNKKSGKEFLVVAILAVVLLAAGGWFVMKTRTENEEKARIAAEAKAASDREAAEAKAASDREAAMLKKTAEAAKVRDDQILVRIRSQLAEAKIAWEVAEREERDAERRVAELRSELRGLRDAPPATVAELNFRAESAQRHANWLRDYLLQHPVKLARARLEERVQGRALGDIAPAAEELQRLLKGLQEALAASRNGEGSLVLASNLPTLKWELRDALGRVRRGQGPERLTGLAFANYELSYHAPAVVKEKKSVAVIPGRANTLTLDFDHYPVEVRNFPTDARLSFDEEPVDVLPDGRIFVRGSVPLVAFRAGYLPAAAVTDVANPIIEFKWVPLEHADLVESYLAGLARHAPLDRMELLSMLETATQGTKLIPPERWLKIFSEIEAVLAGEPNPAKRVSGFVSLANELHARDAVAAKAALELAGKAMAQLDVAQRRALKTVNLTTSAWVHAPVTGTKFFQSLEAALPPDASRLTVFTGFLRCGASAEADETERTAVIDATPALREQTVNAFSNRRKVHAFLTGFMDPVRRALVTDDATAFNQLAAAGIPSTGLLFGSVIRMFWGEGLLNQTVEMVAASNWEALDPDTLAWCMLAGRLDLVERLVTSQRGKRDYNLAGLALGYATTGNKAKTRAMLALLDPIKAFSPLEAYGARAAALELIGDRTASIVALDLAEKRPEYAAGTVLRPGEIQFLLIAALRQGDDARQRRILDRSEKPEERLARASLWVGNIAAAKAEVLRRDSNPDRPIADAFVSFYKDWLVESRGGDVPFSVRPGSAEGLILAYIEKSKGRGRANGNRFQVPHLQSVFPLVKKQEVFYFPTAAINRGLKSGKATIRATINAEGAPTAYHTVEASDPAFAEELQRSMATWTYHPALKLGRPVPGTYTYNGTFKLAE